MKDLEDIISVVDGRRELIDEILEAAPEIKTYISQRTQQCLDDGLSGRLELFLPGDAAGAARERLVLERLRTIALP